MVFLHHHFLPAAINVAASGERALSVLGDVARSQPVMAGLLVTFLGYRWGRRRARRLLQ